MSSYCIFTIDNILFIFSNNYLTFIPEQYYRKVLSNGKNNKLIIRISWISRLWTVLIYKHTYKWNQNLNLLCNSLLDKCTLCWVNWRGLGRPSRPPPPNRQTRLNRFETVVILNIKELFIYYCLWKTTTPETGKQTVEINVPIITKWRLIKELLCNMFIIKWTKLLNINNLLKYWTIIYRNAAFCK